MARIPKKIICLATAAVILCAHVPVAHAEALPNVLEGSATLADNIMSYYALSGSAVANTDWINTLYDSYGSSFGTIYDFAENGMLTLNNDGTWQATTALETAIENAPAYQSLGLDQVFNVSAQEAAAGGGIAASGAATLAGSLGGVASTGVLTLFGGVTAAYWGGIGIGTLIAHLTGLYGDTITQGVPLTDKQILDDYSFTGGISAGYVIGQYGKNVAFVSNNVPVAYITNDKTLYVYNNKSSNIEVKYPNLSLNNSLNWNNQVSVSPNNYHPASDIYIDYVVSGYSSAVYSTLNDFLNSVRNGTYNAVVSSPDVIGPEGNQEGDYDPNTGKYQVPNMLPQVDPSVQSGQPLTLEDWLRFANNAKGNNSDPDAKTKNKKLFDDILDAIKKGVPSTPDNPDPDPDPYHPPTPTPVPDPDYGDPNPDQPDFESETDIPDPVDTGNPWVTPDLLDKFPFCIPKDMIDMVKGFKSADRTAPHISWNFKSPVGHVDYTFNLDLEDFEDVATLLRALELAAFIVGLAFATRYLIGAL